MGSLNREVKLCSLFVELCTPGYEFHNPFRAFLNEYLHGFFPAETISGSEGIFIVDPYFILITQCNSDTPLGILGAALPWSVFCHDKDIPVRCKLYGGPEPCNTTAYDEKINYLIFHIGRITDRCEEIKRNPVIPL